MAEQKSKSVDRRRLKGFGAHLIGYFLVMIVLVPVNMMSTPDNPWFMFPMVGWGSVLALHAAYVMGLFDVLRKR
jgi:two-component system LytT family sensor kinase